MENSEGWSTRLFGPVKVRLAIEALNAPLPINEERYSRLSTFSIHAIPDAMPQAHNPHGRAITFPAFQMAGFILTLNEIAIPIVFLMLYSSKLLNLKDDTRHLFQGIGRALGESIGSIVVTVEGKPWFKLS